MSKNDFEQFLHSRKEPATADWEARKRQWLQAVEQLSVQVQLPGE